MPSIVQSWGCRLRHGLWQRRQFPGKRLAVLFLVAGVACSFAFNVHLPVPSHLLLWVLILLVAAWLLRHAGRPLFGPLFFYDLVRSSRRGEQIGHRCVYAIVLVCVLAVVYWSWFPGQSLEQLLRSKAMSGSERTRFADSFFTNFMMAQFVVVFLLTPLYTASAIAELKERRALDFLLITDLTDREIVLGMLGARLAKLLLLLLTGLPVLSLLEFLGGVDPRSVLASFVVTGMLVVSLGSVSILASVLARTALGAVVDAYLLALILFGCVLLVFSITAPVGQAFANSQSARNWIHLIFGLALLAVILGLVTVLCCRIAVAQLRRMAMRPEEGTGSPRASLAIPEVPVRRNPYPSEHSSGAGGGWGPSYPTAGDSNPFLRAPGLESRSRSSRPPVGTHALLWKEIYAENTHGLAALLQLPPGGALAALVGLFLVVACLNAPQTHGGVGDHIQGWVLRLEIVLIFVLLGLVALSAARRVSRERERRTLDHLLTLPVSSDAILFAKWLGSILSVSHLWWLLGPIWLLGLVAGAVHIASLLLLAAATMIYAGFVAALGLWFSTVSGSTMRASLFTLLVTLLVLAVPGAVTTAGSSVVTLASQQPFADWNSLVLEYGLSPPATFSVLTFHSADLLRGDDSIRAFARILAAVIGLHCYLAATVVLWILTRARLRSA